MSDVFTRIWFDKSILALQNAIYTNCPVFNAAHRKQMKFCCWFFLPFRPDLFAFLTSTDVDLTYLPQHSVSQARKIIYISTRPCKGP